MSIPQHELEALKTLYPEKSEHKAWFHEGWDRLSKRGLVFYQRVVNGYLLSLTAKGRAVIVKAVERTEEQ